MRPAAHEPERVFTFRDWKAFAKLGTKQEEGSNDASSRLIVRRREGRPEEIPRRLSAFSGRGLGLNGRCKRLVISDLLCSNSQTTHEEERGER